MRLCAQVMPQDAKGKFVKDNVQYKYKLNFLLTFYDGRIVNLFDVCLLVCFASLYAPISAL
jgi:hypothetical protein